MKKKQDITISPAPIEKIIPLLDPVRVYTAKELAAMPLSKMNEAIEAQEKYFVLEHTTRMGGGSNSNQELIAKWRLFSSSQRKVTYTLQAEQRVHRASDCLPAGKTWFSEFRGC